MYLFLLTVLAVLVCQILPTHLDEKSKESPITEPNCTEYGTVSGSFCNQYYVCIPRDEGGFDPKLKTCPKGEGYNPDVKRCTLKYCKHTVKSYAENGLKRPILAHDLSVVPDPVIKNCTLDKSHSNGIMFYPEPFLILTVACLFLL